MIRIHDCDWFTCMTHTQAPISCNGTKFSATHRHAVRFVTYYVRFIIIKSSHSVGHFVIDFPIRTPSAACSEQTCITASLKIEQANVFPSLPWRHFTENDVSWRYTSRGNPISTFPTTSAWTSSVWPRLLRNHSTPPWVRSGCVCSSLWRRDIWSRRPSPQGCLPCRSCGRRERTRDAPICQPTADGLHPPSRCPLDSRVGRKQLRAKRRFQSASLECSWTCWAAFRTSRTA